MLKDIMKNPIMLTDCYNLSHSRLKENVDFEVSHLYNRAKPMILFGMKEIVTNLLNIKITKEMVDEAESCAKIMGLVFPRELWDGVVNDLNGNIPLMIQCLPEGLYCPTGTPFMQVRNTVKGYGELCTWFEPIFMSAYFPSACATRALAMRKYLEAKQKEFGYDDSFLWRFHSFGFRGHKSLEDAYFADTSWSMFLQGTDGFHVSKHMPNQSMGSIPALAHKVTQQFDDEFDCFMHSIDVVAESGENIVALVIDTFDCWRVINNYVEPLAKYAMDKDVRLVFRPDSGDIFEQAVAIYKIAQENVLPNVSVIIGEGMSFEVVKEYDAKFIEYGVPLNFINYGIGAGFYKDIDRDYLGYAMKTAYSNGEPRMKVVKSNPFKQSIPNIIHLTYDENDDMIVNDGDGDCNGLHEIIYSYINEDLIVCDKVDATHFDEVRQRALKQNTTQERIKLSEETQTLIKAFHEKYD